MAPIAWAAIASTAAFTLGIYEDFGLTVAALVAAALVVPPRARITS